MERIGPATRHRRRRTLGGGDFAVLGGVIGWVEFGQREHGVDVRARREPPDPHRDEVRACPHAVALPFSDARVGAKVCALGRDRVNATHNASGGHCMARA